MIKGFEKSENNRSGIYRIRSMMSGDNRTYIGSASKFGKRFNEHVWSLKTNKHHSAKLLNFYKKYGCDSLLFEIVEIIENKDELITKEQYYIDLEKPYFNIVPFAGSTRGRICSDETKRKISDANKGRKHTDEHKKKLSEITRERNLNMSAGTRLKLSNTKSIPVAQYDLEGNFLMTYPSSKQAAFENGHSKSDVNACCNGKKIKRVGLFQYRFFSGDKNPINPYEAFHKKTLAKLKNTS